MRPDRFAAIKQRKNTSGVEYGTGINGKVALVTGANRETVAAITAELAREGMHLCLIARDPAKLREVADKLRRAHNIDVEVVSSDLRDPAAPQQAVAAAVGQFGRLDLLVNNAGAPNGPIYSP